MADTCTGKTCKGCRSEGSKLTFLGFRSYCLRFKCLRNERCIDWAPKK